MATREGLYPALGAAAQSGHQRKEIQWPKNTYRVRYAHAKPKFARFCTRYMTKQATIPRMSIKPGISSSTKCLMPDGAALEKSCVRKRLLTNGVSPARDGLV